jgi:hypothetical protein
VPSDRSLSFVPGKRSRRQSKWNFREVIEKICATAIAVSLERSEGTHSETETLITAPSNGSFTGQARKSALQWRVLNLATQ